jgi:hypothetical protein
MPPPLLSHNCSVFEALGWGGGGGEEGVMVFMGIVVSVTSFVGMAVLLYMLTLTLFVSKR